MATTPPDPTPPDPTPTDPQPSRRPQRRRALIGWIGGFLVVAAILAVVLAGGGGDSHHRHPFKVAYGESMTSADYGKIGLGEDDATVLRRLESSGRPERLVEPFVLVLFPRRQDGVYCTYFEFSDQPEIFARLCFDESSGELVQKLRHNVHDPLRGSGPGAGQVV